MDANDIKNLVFFVVAAGAWAIQAALKRKQEAERLGEVREERQERLRAAGDEADAPEALPDEPDVVFGRRALPPRSAQAPVPPAGRTPPPPPPPRPRPSGQPGRRPHPVDASEEIHLGALEGRQLESRLRATAAATVRRDASGRNARRRLRIDALGGRKQALRTAVLWNEVLAPPLARRGPHSHRRRS